VNVIVYGTEKCVLTRKALRYLKERNIPFQFRDLSEKPLSPGELKNLASGKNAEDFLDRESKAWTKRGLGYMDFDAEEEILSDNGLVATPVVRIDGKVFVRPGLDEAFGPRG